MTVTISWAQFKKTNRYQGGQILYVVATSKVSKATIICVQRMGTVYQIANPRPTVDEFLAEYPGAIEVENIT